MLTSPPPPSLQPIAIYDESDLQSMALVEDCYGSGSSVDPYVLENRTIAWDSAGAAIYIANTTSHLLIRNCTLTGAPVSIMPYSYGVQITNSSNVRIDRCSIQNFNGQILVGTDGQVGGCEDITISNCSLFGPSSNLGGTVIDLKTVSNAVVEDNLVTGGYTGINLFNVADCRVSGNNISYNNGNGLFLSSTSAHNIIEGNLIASNGLGGLSGAVMAVEGSNNLFYGNAFVSWSRTDPYYAPVSLMTNNHNLWNSTEGVGNYWGNQWDSTLGGNESFIGHSVDWNGQVLQQHVIGSWINEIDHHPCRYIIDAPAIAPPVITAGEVTISWSAPSYTLGPVISSYVVVRSDGVRFSVAANALSYVDGMTGEWSSYSYAVQAQNAWGAGGVGTSSIAQNMERPSLSIISALNNTWDAWTDVTNPYAISPKNILVEWRGYDSNSALPLQELSHYWVTLDNSTWLDVGPATNYTFDKIVEGKHAVQVKGQDADGNIVLAEKAFSVYRLLEVSMDLDAIKATLGSDVTASVTVIDYATGQPLSQVAVDFYQSVDGGMTYGTNKFASGSTDNGGKVTVSFIPASTSNYVIQARAAMGNVMGVSTRQYVANVSLTVAPYEGKNAFSVLSTSMVTDLSFDSITKVLRFTVSGPTGTTGETKVSIAKSLVADGHSVNVSLDQNAVEYTVTSMGDYWVLTFTYHHSTHAIAVGMPTLGTQAPGGVLGLDPLLLVGLISVVVVVLVGVFLVRRRKT